MTEEKLLRLYDMLLVVYLKLTTDAALGRFDPNDPLDKMLDELYTKVDEVLDEIDGRLGRPE